MASRIAALKRPIAARSVYVSAAQSFTYLLKNQSLVGELYEIRGFLSIFRLNSRCTNRFFRRQRRVASDASIRRTDDPDVPTLSPFLDKVFPAYQIRLVQPSAQSLIQLAPRSKSVLQSTSEPRPMGCTAEPSTTGRIPSLLAYLYARATPV